MVTKVCDLVVGLATWPAMQDNCHTWRVTRPTLPPSLKPARLCILELTVIKPFIGYHWYCVSGYCACAVSRDLCVEGKFYSESTTLPPSLTTLRLFVHELRVITIPVDYHWKCVRGHCACGESPDPWVGGQKQLHIWNPRPRFAYSLYNFYWARRRLIVVYSRAVQC